MNQKERKLLKEAARYGSPAQAQAARDTLRQLVDAQNAREATWSRVRLSKAILRESHGDRLTRREYHRRTPVAVLLDKENTVAVYTWRHYWVSPEPYYTGSLADYWRVMLKAQ